MLKFVANSPDATSLSNFNHLGLFAGLAAGIMNVLMKKDLQI